LSYTGQANRAQRTEDMVLGHEGVGIVEELGPDAELLKKGDRVGWGYETDSCGHCQNCLRGEEIFCPQRALYSEKNFDQGSFASHAIWREAFLHAIPDELTDQEAAPLQCGGATVFTALEGAKPSDTIGILGMGGLGHLAIQFAAKMGCRVIVLSGSDRKKEDAMKLGAHDFIAMKDQSQTLEKQWKLNRLLVTTAAQPAWDIILPLMAPKSRIYPLSVSDDNLVIPYMPLILGGIAVQGSLVASRATHREMLSFAALHGVRPIIEPFPMTEDGIKEALDRLDQGKMHFRAVLVTE
jgi:D-arabinose 1-dehydrogenase-like Zn-dependent alcohol dehydrogenase